MADKTTNGAWINAKGDPVDPNSIERYDIMTDNVVEDIHRKAVELHRAIEKFKTDSIIAIRGHQQTLELIYNVKAMTSKGNKRLTNYSNTRKVEINISSYIDFDDRLNTAKELIDECIEKWSTGARKELVQLINQAFKVDKKGNLDRDRIINLTKLDIDDPTWIKAVELIRDSITIVARKEHLKFSFKDDSGKWKTLPLDIAKV